MSRADLPVRQQWDAYQAAYAECLGATSTKQSPWYVVPADDKWNARLIISQAIVETMKSLSMKFPSPTKQHRGELKKMRRVLKREGKS